MSQNSAERIIRIKHSDGFDGPDIAAYLCVRGCEIGIAELAFQSAYYIAKVNHYMIPLTFAVSDKPCLMPFYDLHSAIDQFLRSPANINHMQEVIDANWTVCKVLSELHTNPITEILWSRTYWEELFSRVK